jgi:hypothetical protein
MLTLYCRWLMMKGRDSGALAILSKINRNSSEDTTSLELAKLRETPTELSYLQLLQELFYTHLKYRYIYWKCYSALQGAA